MPSLYNRLKTMLELTLIAYVGYGVLHLIINLWSN